MTSGLETMRVGGGQGMAAIFVRNAIDGAMARCLAEV